MNSEIKAAKRTAISRKKLSAPVDFLWDMVYIGGHHSILDYGCGRGDDVAILKQYGFSDVNGYDPNWAPKEELLNKKYDVVLCTYVLNVVSAPVRDEILQNIKKCLKPDGVAYVSVRRDIKKDTHTKIGTSQYPVYLNEAIFIQNASFCTYVIRNAER